MRINKLISDRNNPDRPMTDREYLKLRTRFFFNVPIIEDDSGNIQNPVNPEEKELFNKFLMEAGNRGEIFNPMYDEN